MRNRNPKIIFLTINCLLLLAMILIINHLHFYQTVKITVEVKTRTEDTYQLFYDTGKGFNETESVKVNVLPADNYQSVVFVLPPVSLRHFRFDPGSMSKLIEIKEITLKTRQQSATWTPKEILSQFIRSHDFAQMTIVNSSLRLEITGSDPQFVYAQNIAKIVDLTDEARKRIFFILAVLLFSFGIVVIWFRERVKTDKMLNGIGLGKFGKTFNFILWFVLLITTIAVFVPFSPAIPTAGLDPSWVFGINQAVAQGLSFGREIVFTFGPYASVYTKTYHPSTDFMMLSASLYLALSYWACYILLMKGVKWVWILAFYTVLAGVLYERDALLFSFPLVVALTTFKIVSSEDEVIAENNYSCFYVAWMFAPLGLLPLIKGTLLILCAAIATLSSAFLFINKKRALAIICLTSPTLSMLFFWNISGQSVILLPNYFIGIANMASGYTEAMGVKGGTLEVILYLVSSALIFLSLFMAKPGNNSAKVFIFCVLIVFLFLSFKDGFVRHDGHAIRAGTSILIGALMLPFVINPRIIPLVVFCCMLSWFYIDSQYIKTSTATIINNLTSTYSSPWNGLKTRIKEGSWPWLEFDSRLKSLSEQASFPIFRGTTDIYSYNQSYLIASGNTWSPRPIFQSYASYTSTLAEKNRNHLLGEQAPENVIFRVEPIDQRIPSIEDGASWPILMGNYQPTQISNGFLFLQKQSDIVEIAEPLKLSSHTRVFGETINLPQSSHLVFAQIQIEPTFWGSLANVFFKPSQLQITIELKSGTNRYYRIIAGMAKSGFLISPLIENTEEFALLFGKKGYLDRKLVKSFKILPTHGKSILWNDKYTVTLSQLGFSSSRNLSQLSIFDRIVDRLPVSNVTIAKDCQGSIDVINDKSPTLGHFSTSCLLKVGGWVANSIEKGVPPKDVYVVLTDDKGKRSYLRTRRASRPDVGLHYERPELIESGFITFADISALEGEYTLGLAVKNSENINICPQFKFPVTITK